MLYVFGYKSTYTFLCAQNQEADILLKGHTAPEKEFEQRARGTGM